MYHVVRVTKENRKGTILVSTQSEPMAKKLAKFYDEESSDTEDIYIRKGNYNVHGDCNK